MDDDLPKRQAGAVRQSRAAVGQFRPGSRIRCSRNSAATTPGGFLAVEAIERLIQRTRARWIILSYSSGGRATADELNRVLCEHGNILEVLEVDHKRNVMSSMKWTNEWTRDAEAPNREFLFLVEKR